METAVRTVDWMSLLLGC